MHDPNTEWFGRVENLVQEVVRRGVYPLTILTGGCCVGALAGMVGAVLGALGGLAAAATWLRRHGFLVTRGQASSGDRNLAERGTEL